MAGNAPTTDELRHSIDSGRTGDKVAFPDPAAAPLGSDDEAAGTPPTAAQRRRAAADMPHHVPPRGERGLPAYIALSCGAAALIPGMAFLAAG